MGDSIAPPSRRLPARYVLFGAVAGTLALGATRQSDHAVGRPSNDEDVIAQVPARDDPEIREREQLRQSAEQAPADLPKALALAQNYIEASRRDGDPRYLGAAEAALAHWTAEADPPPEVRLLRATLLQSRHEFDAALVDLDRVLAVTPDDAQAWLTSATVLTVQGKYDRARQACEKLRPLASSTYSVACVSSIDAVTGHGVAAQQALAAAAAASRSRSELAWLESLSGEQAFWLGDATKAEAQLKSSLALDASDRYTRGVYADLLLDAGRLDEARALLQGHENDDALALRLALIELANGHRDADVVTRVQQNFNASRLRGDAVHRREEARLLLAQGQAARALDCALESWAVQHEPWDARLVLECAARAQTPQRAAPVVEWLPATGFESPKLRVLAAQLKDAK